MEGSLISWWAGEPVRRYLWSACHRVDEPGRVSRPSFKKCTQAISWRAESATGNEKTPVVKGETRKLRKVTGALFIYPRSRRDRPHAAVPPTTPRHTLLLIRESCAHIRFNLLSLLVWIWLIITMGIPKQQILKWMTDFLFIYLFFSIPGSRLEMSFVKKVKLSPRRITFFPGSCPSSRALHGARLFSPRPAALSLLSERERVTPPEPQRRRDWGGTKKKKPRKACSQRLAQMADVSAWQATWDPADLHGAASMHCTDHTKPSETLALSSVHVCCVLTSDWEEVRDSRGPGRHDDRQRVEERLFKMVS